MQISFADTFLVNVDVAEVKIVFKLFQFLSYLFGPDTIWTGCSTEYNGVHRLLQCDFLGCEADWLSSWVNFAANLFLLAGVFSIYFFFGYTAVFLLLMNKVRAGVDYSVGRLLSVVIKQLVDNFDTRLLSCGLTINSSDLCDKEIL